LSKKGKHAFESFAPRRDPMPFKYAFFTPMRDRVKVQVKNFSINSHSTVPGKKYLCKPYTESDCKDSQKEAFTWFSFWVQFYLFGIWYDFQRILRTSGGDLIENFFRILLCSLLDSVVLIKVPWGEEIHPA